MEAIRVVPGHPRVSRFQSLVRFIEFVPYEDGQDFAGRKGRRSTAGWIRYLFGQTVVYPNEQIHDMLFL